MRIKTYIEYLKELREVVTDVSRSGKSKVKDVVYDDPSSAKSPSSGVLLKNDLKEQEFNDILGKISNSNVKDILRRHVNNPRVERLAVTLNNLEFLKFKKSQLGTLKCEYCNKGPLKIYDIRGSEKFNPKDGATADHKNPQSRGGSKFDYDNMAVCCNRCNQLKGNMKYEDWMDKISNININNITII